MRENIVGGVGALVATVVLVLVGGWLSLDLVPELVLGVACGFALVLIADRTIGQRVGAFAVGLVLMWVAYLLRAGLLPDSTGGRLVALLLAVAGCVVLAVATAGRMPLWASLLGAGALSAVYEAVYTNAPPQVVSTSTSTVTALVLTVGAGFFVASLIVPTSGRARVAPAAEETQPRHDLMEQK